MDILFLIKKYEIPLIIFGIFMFALLVGYREFLNEILVVRINMLLLVIAFYTFTLSAITQRKILLKSLGVIK